MYIIHPTVVPSSFFEKVVFPLSVPSTDEPLGLTETKFQIFRTSEFSLRSESSVRESYVFRRSILTFMTV